MLRLTHYAAALATLLEAVRASGGPGLPLELLRKESLAGLSPQAACKVRDRAGGLRMCCVRTQMGRWTPRRHLPPPAALLH